MTIFVLIMHMYTNNGVAVATQEFNSQETCLYAKKMFEKDTMGSIYRYGYAICVEK